VKLVLDEVGRDAIKTLVRDRVVLTSRVAVVEVTKAVARGNPEADAGPVLSRFVYVELDPELARVAAATGGAQLRALDAIHVASALRIATEIEAFVTYDARQATAAQAVGLPVLTPGDDRP
jgi:predicted nucleic acid-binding protein